MNINKLKKFSIFSSCVLTFNLVASSCTQRQTVGMERANSDISNNQAVLAQNRFQNSNQQNPTSTQGFLPQSTYPVPVNASSILLPNGESPFGETYTPISSNE